MSVNESTGSQLSETTSVSDHNKGRIIGKLSKTTNWIKRKWNEKPIRMGMGEKYIVITAFSYILLACLRLGDFLSIDTKLIAILTISGGCFAASDFLETISSIWMEMGKKLWSRIVYILSIFTLILAVTYLTIMPYIYYSPQKSKFFMVLLNNLIDAGDGMTILAIGLVFGSIVIRNQVIIRAKKVIAESIEAEKVSAGNVEAKEALVVPLTQPPGESGHSPPKSLRNNDDNKN
ncbi:hypothetical protein N6H14_14830 [Paenibacillus sp. CC-CFT747]|nr:hypothetical protein N6H14_14830 [Paenibacillus sp. CC-CFT747]